MKLICIYCKEIIKKRNTKIFRELIRVGTSNMHTQVQYRICNKCGAEVWDAKLEEKNLKNYIKQYKFTQRCQAQEVQNAK